jgi:hypothetical protein
MSPAVANGKVCYLEIPAVDVERSADFYRDVFRWVIRRRGDGALAFDDATGEVSGSWVTGQAADVRCWSPRLRDGRQRRRHGREGDRGWGRDHPADRR